MLSGKGEINMLTQDKVKFFKDKIQEVIDLVPGFKKFIIDFYSDNLDFDFYETVSSFVTKNISNYTKHGFLFSLGYTKLVLLIDEGAGFEYVVKFPFIKTDKYLPSETDYCKVELNVYEKVKKCCPEILNLFAECTSFEMDVENLKIPIYLMERVEVDEDLVASYSNDCEDGFDSDVLVENFFVKTLPEEKNFEYNMLCEFLNDNKINDIHEGNVGIRKNWTPCIIDYSGWRS